MSEQNIITQIDFDKWSQQSKDLQSFFEYLSNQDKEKRVSKNNEGLIVVHSIVKLELKKMDVLTELKNIVFEDQVEFIGVANKNQIFRIAENVEFQKNILIFNHTPQDKDGNLALPIESSCKFQSLEIFGHNLLSLKVLGGNQLRGNLLIEECIFENIADFSNFFFGGEVIFRNSHFTKDTTFKDSVFENVLKVDNCLFDEGVIFTNTVFKDIPIFENTSFKNSKKIGIANADVDRLTFEKIVEYANREIEKKNGIQKTQDDGIDREKAKIAKVSMESFRMIKDILIGQNNILDASEWHKLELYAKEVWFSCHSQINKNLHKFKPQEMELFSILRIKRFVDRAMLSMYRILSDHHTNLLKVCNSLVLLMAWFICNAFWFFDKYKDIPQNKVLDSVFIQKVIKFLSLCGNKFLALTGKDNANIILVVILVVILLAATLALVYSLYQFFKVGEKLKQWFKDFIKSIKTYLCWGTLTIFIAPFATLPIYTLVENYWDLYFSLTYISFFCFTYFFLLSLNVLTKGIIVYLSYLIVLIALSYEPTFFFPASSLFAKDLTPLLSSITAVYFFLFFLVVFSLQKTARKNSIIPN